jgi:hypothetical protein
MNLIQDKKVLILGNGLSRMSFVEFIEQWKGEVWGCNYCYIDWGHKLTRLTGHVRVMEEAILYRKKYKLNYEIWGGNLGHIKSDKQFTCDKQFQKDSGTTLVAQALTEKLKVYCLGFDLGGRDIYSPGHHLVDKTSWIIRWRILANFFGLDNIIFIGYDHKPFLLSKKDAKDYYRKYIRGKPHIVEKKYLQIYDYFNFEKPNDDKTIVDVIWKDNTKKQYIKKVAKIYEKKGLCRII